MWKLENNLEIWKKYGNLKKKFGKKLKVGKIHLTGAATNPWIRFESDDSFIKFEIGTN